MSILLQNVKKVNRKDSECLFTTVFDDALFPDREIQNFVLSLVYTDNNVIVFGIFLPIE